MKRDERGGTEVSVKIDHLRRRKNRLAIIDAYGAIMERILISEIKRRRGKERRGQEEKIMSGEEI